MHILNTIRVFRMGSKMHMNTCVDPISQILFGAGGPAVWRAGQQRAGGRAAECRSRSLACLSSCSQSALVALLQRHLSPGNDGKTRKTIFCCRPAKSDGELGKNSICFRLAKPGGDLW